MALEAQNNPFTSVLMVEAADPEAIGDADPSAGQRRLVVGADHKLYLVSDAGVKTEVGAAAGAVATDAIWDAAGDLVQGTGANTAAKLSAGTAGKVLTSNGAAAALTWETPSAGASNVIPTVEQYVANAASTTSLGITISAATTGKRIVVLVGSSNRDVNSVTCTNTTFTEVGATNFSTTVYVSVYVGVVSGTSGTSVTIAATGSDFIFADAWVIADTLTPTGGSSTTLTNTDVTTLVNSRVLSLSSTRGTFWAHVGYESNGTTNLRYTVSAPHAPGWLQNTLVSAIGYAPGGTFTVNVLGGTASADYAGILVPIT